MTDMRPSLIRGVSAGAVGTLALGGFALLRSAAPLITNARSCDRAAGAPNAHRTARTSPRAPSATPPSAPLASAAMLARAVKRFHRGVGGTLPRGPTP